MSNTIETRASTGRCQVPDRPLRPQVAEALQQIATTAEGDDTAVITDRSVEFKNGAERTKIIVTPIDLDTVDGLRITEIITIRTSLTAFKYFDESDYSYVNVFATTGAIVRDHLGEDAIVSRVPLFEHDDGIIEDVYLPLIADGARMQVVGPYVGYDQIRGRAGEYNAAALSLPMHDEPSYWSEADFAYAKEWLRDKGAYANAGADGLTVEFGWEPGAVSAIAGHCTSLLEIRADVPHPAAGNGIFYRLRLPLDFSDKEAANCAARLNRAEIDSLYIPPFFGAWGTMPNSGTVSFSGFWPNLLYSAGSVNIIAIWCAARSRFARQVIGNAA